VSSARGASYTFTVFTPTFNRAHTLHRVYESLVAQTFRDFEWLVVDDGSTDGTDALVTGWRRTADFAITYIRQPNQGKHIAHNVAVHEARGALFLTLDSDDACVPEAMERLDFHWKAIPESQRDGFSAVTVLVKDQHGKVVGDRFPFDMFDGNLAELVYRYKVRGEKWGFQRTDILRQHLFSAESGRGCIPEGIVWQQIGRSYRMRFVNEVLRTYYVEARSLSHGRTVREDAYGRRLYYIRTLNDHIDYLRIAPAKLYLEAVQFARSCFHLGIPALDQMGELHAWRARLLWAMALPIGWLLWLRDRITSGMGVAKE
jgi:glycosyltransferase involved in cell wall biosynthesis